jgi:hypothetical protein
MISGSETGSVSSECGSHHIETGQAPGRVARLREEALSIATLAGFQLAVVLGGLFALPVAGVLWVLIGAGYRNAICPDVHKALYFPLWPRRRPGLRRQPRP